MKHASLLIALSVLLAFQASAQSTTTVEKSTKSITITTSKVDESGKTITETYIAEGEEPAKILQEMAINPEAIKRVDVLNAENAGDEERLFLYRSAGDKIVIEGKLNENMAESIIIDKMVEAESAEGKPIRIITRTIEAPYGNWSDHATTHSFNHDRKSNCAALGVYVTSNRESAEGAYINSLIEKGGAMEAGLQAGDVVTKIGDYEVTDFETLHTSLSNYRAGDVVLVRFLRGEKKMKARVELKDWAQLPGHEWRARTDCGKPEAPVTEDQVINDEPNGIDDARILDLADVRMYPNPTEGQFALSFSLKPGPVNVAITDINGKVIYNEEYENLSGQYSRDINLKDIPQGNYVLTIKQGDRIYTDQISKQ